MERRKFNVLKVRQHKMEAQSLDTAVKKFTEELHEVRWTLRS